MKNTSLSAISIAIAITSAVAAGPLKFDIPKNATIEEREYGDSSIYSYTIVLAPKERPGLLMLSSLPGNTPFGAMESMAETMRITFESELRNNPKLKIDNLTAETSNFKLGIWEGYKTVFVGDVDGTEIFQLMFTLWDGKQIWNGQFTGFGGDSEIIDDILKSAKNNSEQGAAANP